ncbi:MAG: hypothetical protein EAY81_08695 [Bacteroidetes bacterium]|nr:MAG: hypothetical protein EAY81_08695 [Bacteroidota bacterium]
MSVIIGISAFYHDSAAAIVVDGKIIAAAQEERFTREKHTADFPVNAITYCLQEAGLALNEIDAIVFYDKPFLKFERLLETYYAFAPKGILNFIKAMPVWLNEKLFLKKRIYDELKKVADYDKRKVKLLFSEHHLSHAASTFYPSPYQKAAILTIDGVGEWCTASIGLGEDGQIQLLKEMMFPHSVGLLYSAFTYYLGFTVNSGEYKLMGLAPYGNANAQETIRFIQLIKEQLVSIKEDGSVWLNQSYFNYATGLKMVNERKWKALFGFERKAEKDELGQHHCNLALAIQLVTEEIVIKMAKEAKRLTGADYLCLAGGVALNCVANGKLLKENIFNDIYIQPAAGDAGGALGAALVVNYMYYSEPRVLSEGMDVMAGSYLGPAYSEREIQQMNKRVNAAVHYYQNFADLTQFVAAKIAAKNIVGWFQGRMEFGPRALGNRSILADVRDESMQKKLNLNIKYREGFRPFAPSVLAEQVANYFEMDRPSPYMLFVAPINKKLQKELPKNYSQLSIFEKLYITRSDVQPITHVDFSARIQTVHKETNWRYWELINEYHKQTGYPILVNTSFNVRGEPIVCSPLDAYQCFMATEMDYLVIGNFVYCKTDQPDWQNKEKWRRKFKPD